MAAVAEQRAPAAAPVTPSSTHPSEQPLRGRALLDPAVAQHTSFVRAPGFLSALEVELVLRAAAAHGDATGGLSQDGTTYLHYGREPCEEKKAGSPSEDIAAGIGGSKGGSGGSGGGPATGCDGTGSVPPSLAGIFRRIRGHVAAVDAEHWGTLCEKEQGGLDLQLTAGGVGDDVHARCVEYHVYSATARRTCGAAFSSHDEPWARR